MATHAIDKGMPLEQDGEPEQREGFTQKIFGMKLGDVCKIKYGTDHKKLNDGSIPVSGSGGVMRHVGTPYRISRPSSSQGRASLETCSLLMYRFGW